MAMPLMTMKTMGPASRSAPPLSPLRDSCPHLLRYEAGEEEAMTESQQLVQDLANVKRSVGPLVRCRRASFPLRISVHYRAGLSWAS